MFQTTRRRLALWYTTVTAVLLLLFATGVYTYVRTTLVERVDDTLNHVIEIVERSLTIETDRNNNPTVNIEASFRNNQEASEDDRIDLEWFNPEGNLMWSTFATPPNIPLHVNPKGETITPNDGIVLRQITERVSANRLDNNGLNSNGLNRSKGNSQLLGYLRVSHPWFEVSKPSRQLIIDLAAGSTLMLAAVAFIGWFLSGLAIAPVHTSYQQLKQFTADASHELRNPIAVIQTNVQVALADPDEQFQRSQLEVVERLTRRLGRLVDDLLFLARQESGLIPMQTEEIDLSELLENVVEEQQAIAQEKHLTLTYTPSPIPHPPSHFLHGDPNQLTRLFTNLIANAIQYTTTGSVNVQIKQINNQNSITVTDTGIGIPSENLDRIFDRFYRVDAARSRSAGGSGLGLAIAKIITENHQGQLTLQSQPGQGTTATVTLPIRSPNSKTKRPAVISQPSAS